jgi:hypothetical protein
LAPFIVIGSLAYIVTIGLAGYPISCGLIAYSLAPISAVLVALLIFNKWAWKWWWLNSWFSRRPVICGTWHGHINSSWVDTKTGQHPAPIKCYAVIRQNWLMLSLRLYTAESESCLIAERIHENDDGVFQVACVYRNDPKASLRGVRSEIHYGAMILKVEATPSKALSGHYWTDRLTRGEIRLEFKSDVLVDSYIAAEEHFGAESAG